MEILEAVPEQYREPLKAAGITTAEALAKNWADAQSALGSSIRIPGRDAGAEDVAAFHAKLREKVPTLVTLPASDDKEAWGKFYNQLGRPESPDKYTFEAVEGLDPAVSKQMGDWLATIVHDAGLTAAQAARVHKAMAESTRDNTQTYQRGLEEKEAKLKAEYGQHYQERVKVAENMLREFGAAEAERQEMLRLFPSLVSVLSKTAEALGEDKLFQDIDRTRLSRSVSDIEHEIAEIRGNRQHPFHDPRSPAHKAAAERVERLYAERARLQGSAA